MSPKDTRNNIRASSSCSELFGVDTGLRQGDVVLKTTVRKSK